MANISKKANNSVYAQTPIKLY